MILLAGGCAQSLSAKLQQLENAKLNIRAERATEAEQLVVAAELSLQHFLGDPEMENFRALAKKARAVFIAPEVWKFGVGIGGSTGDGILLVRDKLSGEWLGPAFYTLDSGSLGIQFGVQVSEVAFLVMEQDSLYSLFLSSFNLGAVANLAAGPVGKGVGVATSDIVSYSRSEGIYSGVSFTGAALSVNLALNHAYYGEALDPVDILVRGPARKKSMTVLSLVERLGGQ
jgi:lipid-binding SYLF domain-containing protein